MRVNGECLVEVFCCFAGFILLFSFDPLNHKLQYSCSHHSYVSISTNQLHLKSQTISKMEESTSLLHFAISNVHLTEFLQQITDRELKCPATWCNYWKSVWRQITATMHNKLAFLLIWNVCFKDRDQVCDHLLLVAAFKVTLMHQDSNKIAKNWSFSLQVSLAIMWNLFMITWRLTVTNGQKSQTCCRLLQTYCHLHSHVILTIQPEKARKFRNSSTNGDLVAAGRHFTCNRCYTSILLHTNTIRIQPVEFWIAKRSVAVALISEYELRLIAGCWKSECISIFNSL